jgi:hypothetical protein
MALSPIKKQMPIEGEKIKVKQSTKAKSETKKPVKKSK